MSEAKRGVVSDIETAPMNGRFVIVMLHNESGFRWASVAQFIKPRGERKEGWFDKAGDRLMPPTHWMPLPDAPAQEGGAE